MLKNRRLGLILTATAGALLWAAPAIAQDAEAVFKELIQVMNELADCLAGIQDQQSAQAAQGRMASLAQRMQNLRARGRSFRLSPAEDQRLKEQYGSSLVAAMERVVKEQERLEGKGLSPPGGAAKSRRQLEALRDKTFSDSPAAPSSSGVAASSGSAAGGSGSTPPQAGTWAFLLPVLMFVVFIACVASLYTEGMWGNAIRLVNVIFAALLATNFWEPVARYAEGMAPTFTYFWDFLCLWALFGLFLVLLRLPTQFLSRVKVRFLKIADRIGSAFFAAWVGWVMVCFTMFTLHTAPLGEYFLYGAFRAGEANLPLGLAPDLQWAGFVQKMSLGPFSRGLAQDEVARYGTTDDPGESQLAVFDRNGDFVPKYAARRRALERYIEEKGTPRVSESDVVKR